jgi:hypothetical protein
MMSPIEGQKGVSGKIQALRELNHAALLEVLGLYKVGLESFVRASVGLYDCFVPLYSGAYPEWQRVQAR